MKFKDYYAVLELERNADQDEIKRAYRKAARKFHPDVSKEEDAEERFKEIGEAYEVLKDPEKRAAYDQLGKNWQQGNDFRPPPDWDPGFEFGGGGYTEADHAAFSEFFESLFGRGAPGGNSHGTGRARGAYQFRGEDHHAKVSINLETAFLGGTNEISFRAAELDERGQVVVKDRTLSVKIPKGISAGQKIRLAGQGGGGMGGAEPGDLYLEIDFKPHKLFHSEGKDIYLNLPVAPWEAALGATVEVPTPKGKLELKIPKNSSGGKKLRLKGQGIPAKQPGDMYVVLQIALPSPDSEQAQALYEEMKEKLAFNPRENLVS